MFYINLVSDTDWFKMPVPNARRTASRDIKSNISNIEQWNEIQRPHTTAATVSLTFVRAINKHL